MLLHNFCSETSSVLLRVKNTASNIVGQLCAALQQTPQTNSISQKLRSEKKRIKKKKWYSEYKRPHQFIQRHSTSLALLAQTCSESKADGERRSHRGSMRCEEYQCEETCSILSTLTQIAKHTPDRLLQDGKLESAPPTVF